MNSTAMEKRNIREEVNLNPTEEVALEWLAGRLGLSKSATLRTGFLELVEKVRMQDRLQQCGIQETGK